MTGVEYEYREAEYEAEYKYDEDNKPEPSRAPKRTGDRSMDRLRSRSRLVCGDRSIAVIAASNNSLRPARETNVVDRTTVLRTDRAAFNDKRTPPVRMVLLGLRLMKSVAEKTMLVLLVATFAHAEDDDGSLFFDAVQPLLKAKCVSCHGRDEQEGNLRLDSLAAALRGGDSGPALVPGDANKSLLLQAIRHQDDVTEMPPKEKLADEQVETVARWIAAGASWPRPVMVLFDDETPFIESLSKGKASVRVEREDRASGKIAVAVSPRERFSEQIANWNFAVREHPKPDEYRFIRFAWKKIGGGGAMIEVASSGRWPDAKVAQGRYVSGSNETGLAAVEVSDKTPDQWKIVTVDLWKDLGEFTLTGLSLMASGGKETLFDTILLAADEESLDTYRPGRGSSAFQPDPPARHVGDAWSDAENPIAKIFNGQRLDLWSLKPPLRPEVSNVKSSGRVRTPVDHFVLSQLESQGLTLSPKSPFAQRK